MTLLKDKDRGVNEILKYLQIKQSTLSSHLAILRKAGLVEFVINGKQRIYKFNKETIINFINELNRFVNVVDLKTGDEIIVRK